MNRALVTSLAAVAAAQLMKLPVQYRREGKWDWRQAFASGGMPSSHSSGAAALAAYCGCRYGWKSSLFAVAGMLGAFVMYDAMNVRRHAGEIAIKVNDLDVDVELLAGHHPGVYHVREKEKLEERIGHQPAEVLAGALLGTAIGIAGARTKN